MSIQELPAKNQYGDLEILLPPERTGILVHTKESINSIARVSEWTAPLEVSPLQVL
jgi:hypothetical protein